ncbi:MAG: ABC transporter ATP-binding protein [Solirubrobacteraceae bacterium]|nr:ABC transporter ATP-binding protein [Solirubrobacteraceae bacterium]
MLRVEVATRLGLFELDAAIEVPAGRCLALAGPSGAGKTSVLRVAAGLVRPERGIVHCGDEVWLDVAAGVCVPPEARRCGYVFQEYALFPHLRAWQNVAYGLAGEPREDRRRRALELLDRFGLADRADARPRTLSGGERQRVALARALAREPLALLLDEPLSALDARSRASASRELLAVLRSAGAPVLLVTHDFAEAALLGDRVAIVDGGRIVQEGTAAQLAAAPASAFVADFAGAVVLSGVARRDGDGPTLIELEGGAVIASAERGAGPVSVSVYPWEIELAPLGAPHPGSERNRLEAEVVSVTAVGGRVRVGLAAPQPLVAEISAVAANALDLVERARVAATWSVAATRLLDGA